MMKTDLLAYEDALTRATKDIHARCVPGINVLWDDGHYGLARDIHKVRIWNGLGSVELEIMHDNLMARGDAYRHFLDRAAAAAQQKLTLV